MTRQAFVLRIAPSEVDHVQEALEKNQLIIGWAEARGLLDPELSWEEFREIIHSTYHAGEDNYRKAGTGSGHMWRFIREMSPGDLVVVPYGPNFFVAQVTENASYDDSKVPDDSAYRRPVIWLNEGKSIPRIQATSPLISRMKIRGTCADATDLLDEILKCLEIEERGEEASFEKSLRDRLVKETLEELQSGYMDERRFEHLIASVLTHLGATSTKVIEYRPQDYGVDIYASFRVAGIFKQVIAVQAKYWKPDPPVGKEVVEQLAHGIERGQEAVSMGVVITAGTISKDAEDAANAYTEENGIPIELVDGIQFATLIVEHGIRPT